MNFAKAWWDAKTAIGTLIAALICGPVGLVRGDKLKEFVSNTATLGELLGHPVHFIRTMM